MSGEKSNDNNEYKSLTVSAPTIVKKQTKEGPKPGWLKRKYLKIKGAASDFWVVGRYGFQLGGAAGLLLGFLVGGFESIRMKSFWPLPMAMIGSGFTFGSIFAISSVMRTQDENGSMRMNRKYEIVYYDQNLGKYVRKGLSEFSNNESLKNNKL